MSTQSFEILSAPQFADETNHQLSTLTDLEAIRAVRRFLGDYGPRNGWFDRRARDLFHQLEGLEAYEDLRQSVSQRDDEVPYYAWACRTLRDEHLSLALSLLTTARRQSNLPPSERAFCENAATGIAENILGEVSGDTQSHLTSLFETIRSTVSPLRLSAEQRLSYSRLADAPQMSDGALKAELEALARLDADWGEEDTLLNLDAVLAGNSKAFLERAFDLIQDREERSFDLAMQLASRVAHTTDCAPARWLLRCLKANCEAEALSVDTTNTENYALPQGIGTEDADQNDSLTVLSEGQVLLAPNYPAVTGTRNSERRAALGNHKTLSRPMDLQPLRIDVNTLHDRLMAEFPWMERVTERICHDLELRQAYGQTAIQIPPLLLWGAPGSGKTRFAIRLADHLSLPSATLSFAGAADDRMLRGTGAGWGTAQPAFPVTQIATTACPNPLLIVDEIEKATPSHNGNPWATMLMFLEPQNAKAFLDECLMATIDLSHINWIATANDTKRMPMPLLSRFRVMETPAPEAQHLTAILSGVRQDLAAKLRVDPRFIPQLGEAEVVFLEQAFQDTGNIRTMIRMTERLLQRRERQLRGRPH